VKPLKFDKKGILSPFTIITSIFTGALFPLLGSLLAIDLDVVKSLYLEGVYLVMIGGFIAHWILSHTIHDLIHMKIQKRETWSKKTLLFFLITSASFLFAIAIYLSIERGWPVLLFSIIGAIVSLYAEGLLHHESQMAFGAMFLVIGGFYVQAATLDLEGIIWIKISLISLFAFFSQYGWLLFYRIDDYKYSTRTKNLSILITKTGLIFLILYFLL
jgi:hypothetical protein